MERSSWIRKMFETGAALKARHGADRVFDFSLGNPNAIPPAAFRETLSGLVRDDVDHRYMPNAGYPDVRKKIAEYVSREQGVPVGPEETIMTCGAGGAMNVALKAILNQNDEVLVSTPCFMEYSFYADNHGGKLVLVPSRPSFELDIEALASGINSSTAAVIINSPNNPTGRVYPEKNLKDLGVMLNERSREIGRSIYLISDEPYRKIVFDGITVPSVLKTYSNSILVTSYSKDLSIPGERIGFLAVHPEIEDREKLVGGMILCNRILGFVNAPALLQKAVARLQGVSVDPAIYQRKRDRLCSALSEIGYRFAKPEGTFYLFPKAPGGDDVGVVDSLQKELILTVPGSGFSCPGYFRIAFCVEDEVIEGSLDGFARAFKAVRRD